jgi:rSAM/selenodomain-associated transferase 1
MSADRRSKTRLANAIGAEQATLIYRALVEHQCAEIPSQWEVSVYFTPANAEEEMRNWLEPHLTTGARFLPQVDGDLGQRLTMVVQTEFARERERIFLVGGDCPGLSQDYFRAADGALDSNDIAIGPAHDGGYVLLGLNKPLDQPEAGPLDGPEPGLPKGLEGLFTDIAWSSSSVLEETLGAVRKQNLSVFLLPPLTDIDDVASLNSQSELIQDLLKKGKRVRTDF